MINDALRHYVLGQVEPLEDTLRRVLREEMALHSIQEESRCAAALALRQNSAPV